MKKKSLEEKLNMIEDHFKSIRLLLSEIKDSLSSVDQNKEKESPTLQSNVHSKQSSHTKIKRISSEEGEAPQDKFEQPKYDIKVVGLGVEKI